MSYTTITKVQQYNNSDLSSIASEVTNWIASVKAWIDKYCGKTFEAASADRYYDGNGRDRIFVDPFVGSPTVLFLKSDGTTERTLTEGASSDFVTYPLNTTEKNEIVLMPSCPIRRFSRAYFEDILDDVELQDSGFVYRRLLKVTASFGASSAIPADVELVATKLVAQIAEKRLKGSDAGVSSETLGDYSVSYKTIDEIASPMGIYQVLDAHREISI